MVAGPEERGVEQPDHVLNGARFRDGRENIAGLDAFDDAIFDTIFYCACTGSGGGSGGGGGDV